MMLGGKIRPTMPPAIAPSLAPRLAARVRGLLDLDLPVGLVHGDGRVDQLDRAIAVHRAEVLQGRVDAFFGAVARDEPLDRLLLMSSRFGRGT